MDPPPSGEDLARMRREFEAARSFEDSDDALYAFRPEVEPLAQPAAAAPNPRLAALQNSNNQARGSQTPPQRKKSLPRQYNPQVHGTWRPSAPAQATGLPVKQISLAEAKQNLLGQFAQEAGEQALSRDFEPHQAIKQRVDEGFVAEDDWRDTPDLERRQILKQRSQVQEHLGRRHVPLASSFVPRGPRSDIAVHSRTNSEDSRSSGSVANGQAAQQQLTGGQWSRNGMVWRATYGGNFTGGA